MPARRARPVRPGYTLLELALVCALIILVSALAYPSLDAMYGSYKMSAAVDGVRAAWGRARALALEEGRSYRFAVVADAGHYRVAPDEDQYWSGSPPDEPDHPATILRGTLPKGVRFTINGGDGSASLESGNDEQAPGPQAGQQTGDSKAEEVPPSNYTTVVVFLANGEATSDVEIRFRVRGVRTTSVSLRALTGVVTVKTLPEGDR